MKPLAERDRLQKQMRSAQEMLSANGARAQQVEREREQTNEARIEAYAKKARGEANAQKAVDEAEAELVRLDKEAERLVAESHGARRAYDQASNELAALYARELPAFAEEAEKKTRAAIDALSAVEEPYRQAFDAWRASEAAWAPLRSAIRGYVEHSEREAGIYPPGHELDAAAAVPEFPLPEPGAVFAGSVPRPAGLKRKEAA